MPRNTASTAAWPWPSSSRLKWSMSRSSSVSGAPVVRALAGAHVADEAGHQRNAGDGRLKTVSARLAVWSTTKGRKKPKQTVAPPIHWPIVIQEKLLDSTMVGPAGAKA